MKKILILSVFAAIIFAGCMSDNIVNPVPQNNIEGFEWLANSDNMLKGEAELTIIRTINGNMGGRITLNELVGKISVTGSLNIPQGAFPGNQNITIVLNDAKFYQEYYPSPYTFRIPLLLNLTYTNADFSTADSRTINFYYMDDNGSIYKAEYDSLIVDPINKILGVVNARIPHFSRWGWAKSTE